MTRAELTKLKDAIAALRSGNSILCLAHLRGLEIRADAEFAAEDAHHDVACRDRPVNIGEAA